MVCRSLHGAPATGEGQRGSAGERGAHGGDSGRAIVDLPLLAHHTGQKRRLTRVRVDPAQCEQLALVLNRA